MSSQIHEWFASHEDGDGDFLLAEHGNPFAVIPPTRTTDTVIYCTKRHSIGKLHYDLGGDASFASIVRYGLPSDDDLNWLTLEVGSRRLLFLGDADPADLLIFAWLQERTPIQHIGLSDALLRGCGVELRDNLTIKLSSSDIAALPLLQQHLDLPRLLGPWCHGLLLAGRRIETEALFSYATCSGRNSSRCCSAR